MLAVNARETDFDRTVATIKTDFDRTVATIKTRKVHTTQACNLQ